MDQDQIIKGITDYIDSPLTDYAIMLSGEWGSGKTYFLTHSIYPVLKENGKTYKYISLIGLNSEESLSQKILKQINPFYDTVKKPQMASEADAREHIFNPNNKEESKDTFYSNIVLCFDDLERIKPEFFETAMGYINTYIEHKHVKCIFLCNEGKLKVDNFKEIKEKYIWFTYLYSPKIKEITKSLNSDLISDADKNTIIEMFERGKCENVRTLKFILSTIEKINKEYLDVNTFRHIEKEYASALITQFCCFYSIELKRGQNKNILDKVSVDNLINMSPPSLTIEEYKKQLNNKEEIQEGETQRFLGMTYYDTKSDFFFKNKSIGNYICTGYFDKDLFQSELSKIDNELFDKKQREHKSRIKNYCQEPFKYSDEGILEKLYLVANEVEKGIFDLDECLGLYWNLLYIESKNLMGFKIDDLFTQKFKSGAKKYVESNNFSQSNSLARFLTSDLPEQCKNKASAFKKYIDEINDTAELKEREDTVKDIINVINSNNQIIVYQLLTKAEIFLADQDANSFFEALMKALPRTTNAVKQGIELRYSTKLSEGTYSSPIPPEKEAGFISNLSELINSEPTLAPNIDKPLSKIYIFQVGQFLKTLI